MITKEGRGVCLQRRPTAQSYCVLPWLLYSSHKPHAGSSCCQSTDEKAEAFLHASSAQWLPTGAGNPAWKGVGVEQGGEGETRGEGEESGRRGWMRQQWQYLIPSNSSLPALVLSLGLCQLKSQSSSKETD